MNESSSIESLRLLRSMNPDSVLPQCGVSGYLGYAYPESRSKPVAVFDRDQCVRSLVTEAGMLPSAATELLWSLARSGENSPIILVR